MIDLGLGLGFGISDCAAQYPPPIVKLPKVEYLPLVGKLWYE